MGNGWPCDGYLCAGLACDDSARLQGDKKCDTESTSSGSLGWTDRWSGDDSGDSLPSGTVV